MTKFKHTIEYTDIEEFEVAQCLNEFADFEGYEDGDKIPLVAVIESGDVEDFVKDYFNDYCDSNNFDKEETVIAYSW